MQDSYGTNPIPFRTGRLRLNTAWDPSDGRDPREVAMPLKEWYENYENQTVDEWFDLSILRDSSGQEWKIDGGAQLVYDTELRKWVYFAWDNKGAVTLEEALFRLFQVADIKLSCQNMLSYASDSFWTSLSETQSGYIEPKELYDRLCRVYPGTEEHPADDTEEIDFSWWSYIKSFFSW